MEMKMSIGFSEASAVIQFVNMDLVDVSIFVENSLKKEWSAPEFAKRFYYHEKASEYVEQLCNDFGTMEAAAKCRILLSVLSLPNKLLSTLWTSLTKLMDIASVDSDEWVAVTLALVKRNLPPQRDLIEGIDDTASSSATNPSQDKFTEAVHEALGKVRRKISDNENKSLSPEFVPLEWAFLCPNLLPVDFKPKNDCFVSHDNFDNKQDASNGQLDALPDTDSGGPKGLAPHRSSVLHNAAVQERIARKADEIARRTLERSKSSLSPGASSSTEIPPEFARVPETIRAILMNPENDKLTPEGKAKVVAFYEKTENKRTGVEMVLLSESREFTDETQSSMFITEVSLKLDYATDSIKRTRTKKKVKISTNLESPGA